MFLYLQEGLIERYSFLKWDVIILIKEDDIGGNKSDIEITISVHAEIMIPFIRVD